MNTKFVMTASTISLGIAGLMLTFAPDEILLQLNLEANQGLLFVLQILGALYFGFGMLNWMNRTSRIGGIYNRPVAIANLSHFMIAAFALIKGLISYPHVPYSGYILVGLYTAFAVMFGLILFFDPIKEPVKV